LTQSDNEDVSHIGGETLEFLRELEESPWRSETRFDDALMDQVFADDFVEIGQSGSARPSRQTASLLFAK